MVDSPWCLKRAKPCWSKFTQIFTRLPNFSKHIADMFLSACISSILRTYYTWKIVTSPDITYHIAQIGLWTYAELATGVIISCLPVIPKFFQHIGPRISSTSSKQARLPGSYQQQLSPRAASMHKKGACGSVLPFWTKYSGSGRSRRLSVASIHRAHLTKEDYIAEGFDIDQSKDNASYELGELPLARPAKTRNDLAGNYREL